MSTSLSFSSVPKRFQGSCPGSLDTNLDKRITIYKVNDIESRGTSY